MRKLGDTRINWRELSMSFEYEDKRVTLQGKPGLHHASAQENGLEGVVRDKDNLGGRRAHAKQFPIFHLEDDGGNDTYRDSKNKS